jgi:hypothetical protein
MISHTYKNMSPKDLDSFGALVTSHLDRDPIFSGIKEASLSDLLPAYQTFSAAKTDFDKFGGSDRSTLRETSRVELVRQLYLTSVIVEGLAKGSSDIVAASGYVLRKTSRPKVAPKKEDVLIMPPSNLKVEDIRTKSGSVRLSWPRVVGARTYAIEKRVKGGDNVWMNGEYTSNTSIELSGFAPDSVMEFRVRTHAVGEGKSEWSAAVGVLIS